MSLLIQFKQKDGFKCPACGEDWTLGWTKPEMQDFLEKKGDIPIKCVKCKAIFPKKLISDMLK
jgi:DNA-directed RNA polymerase subunit RPC12/RpoP